MIGSRLPHRQHKKLAASLVTPLTNVAGREACEAEEDLRP